MAGLLTTLVARRLVDERRALVAGAALLFSPFSLFWGSSVMIEYFAVALVLATILAVFRWNETQNPRSLLVPGLVGSIAAAVKFSTVVPWSVVIAAIVFIGPGSRGRRFVTCVSVLMPLFAVGVGWSLSADHVKMGTAATKPLATAGMIRESLAAIPRLAAWAIWRLPARTIAIEHYGSIGLIALLAAALSLRKGTSTHRAIIGSLLALPLIAVAMFPVQYGSIPTARPRSRLRSRSSSRSASIDLPSNSPTEASRLKCPGSEFGPSPS